MIVPQQLIATVDAVASRLDQYAATTYTAKTSLCNMTRAWYQCADAAASCLQLPFAFQAGAAGQAALFTATVTRRSGVRTPSPSPTGGPAVSVVGSLVAIIEQPLAKFIGVGVGLLVLIVLIVACVCCCRRRRIRRLAAKAKIDVDALEQTSAVVAGRVAAAAQQLEDDLEVARVRRAQKKGSRAKEAAAASAVHVDIIDDGEEGAYFGGE